MSSSLAAAGVNMNLVVVAMQLAPLPRIICRPSSTSLFEFYWQNPFSRVKLKWLYTQLRKQNWQDHTFFFLYFLVYPHPLPRAASCSAAWTAACRIIPSSMGKRSTVMHWNGNWRAPHPNNACKHGRERKGEKGRFLHRVFPSWVFTGRSGGHAWRHRKCTRIKVFSHF